MSMVEPRPTTWRLGIALAAVVLAVHGAGSSVAHGETPTFPPSIVTTQGKIDWISAEADSAADAVEAEAERPLWQQREAAYRALRARGADLLRLIDTITEGSPTLETRVAKLRARVNETVTRANAGLERIANRRLHIGMTPDQVRQIRGEPSHISQITTATGVRERWHYDMSVLSFEDGKLVEILLTLTRE